jgi:hypothetical protein
MPAMGVTSEPAVGGESANTAVGLNYVKPLSIFSSNTLSFMVYAYFDSVRPTKIDLKSALPEYGK